jgi:ABC-type phosphate/phosphonate transport system substrate-binding protein
MPQRQSRQIKDWHKALSCLLILFLLISAGSALSYAETPSTRFYYFNPDSPQSNLGRLKREMDMFLARSASRVTFQPFAHLVDFHNNLKKKQPAFVLLPEWYLLEYGGELQLQPLLIPVRNGATSYRKVLLFRKDAPDGVQNIARHSLAMTSMGPKGEMLLNTILFSRLGVDASEVNIVVVPKDSDALFALALGQVDMALVAEENLERISRINPRIMQAVRPVIESDPIPRPILCYTKQTVPSGEVKKFKDMLLSAGNKAQLIMEMLQIDDWKNISH